MYCCRAVTQISTGKFIRPSVGVDLTKSSVIWFWSFCHPEEVAGASHRGAGLSPQVPAKTLSLWPPGHTAGKEKEISEMPLLTPSASVLARIQEEAEG